MFVNLMLKTGFVAILLWVSSLNVFADNLMITAAAERYTGHDVGVVYINGEVVMRFYSAGIYQSPYVRAKAVADILTDIGSKGTDLASVQVMNGTSVILGIVGNRNVFRVLEDDVIYNNTTAESLANDWANNIKSAVNLAKVDSQALPGTPTRQIGSEKRPGVSEAAVVSPAGTKSKTRSIVSAPKVARTSFFDFFTRINWKMVLIFVLFIAITGVCWIIGKAFKKRRRHVVGDEIITQKASTDELENTVSHLIAELEDKSASITAEFQEKIGYLETLMLSIDKKIELLESYKDLSVPVSAANSPVDAASFPAMPSFEPDEELEPPIKVSRKIAQPETREPALKKDKVAVAPAEKHHRTKQEIIYELSDQGKSVTDIAKKLGIGVGEVKLILDLKQ